MNSEKYSFRLRSFSPTHVQVDLYCGQSCVGTIDVREASIEQQLSGRLQLLHKERARLEKRLDEIRQLIRENETKFALRAPKKEERS